MLRSSASRATTMHFGRTAMHKVCRTAALAIAAIGLSLGSAQAAFINGSVSFTDGVSAFLEFRRRQS